MEEYFEIFVLTRFTPALCNSNELVYDVDVEFQLYHLEHGPAKDFKELLNLRPGAGPPPGERKFIGTTRDWGLDPCHHFRRYPVFLGPKYSCSGNSYKKPFLPALGYWLGFRQPGWIARFISE